MTVLKNRSDVINDLINKSRKHYKIFNREELEEILITQIWHQLIEETNDNLKDRWEEVFKKKLQIQGDK